MNREDHDRKRSLIDDEIREVRKLVQRVPRVSYYIAIIVIGVLLSFLPENLTFGPSWTVLFLALVLIVPLFFAVLKGHHIRTRYLAMTLTGVVTVGLISSVAFLMYTLFAHTATANSLFRDAALLWVANIILFAVWYWEIDQGGPYLRHAGQPGKPDFLFPQQASSLPYWPDWIPSFQDYLFLAFNTSTAFSPTDTLVMSRRGKLLMMVQASISLIIVAVLAARAINIA